MPKIDSLAQLHAAAVKKQIQVFNTVYAREVCG